MPQPSLSPQELAALEAYTNALHRRFGPRLLDILLFGSRARGDAQAGSDIDVAVILDRPDARDLGEARGLVFDIWLTYQVLLSVRAMSRRNWQALAEMQSLFYRNLQHDGISLLPTPA